MSWIVIRVYCSWPFRHIYVNKVYKFRINIHLLPPGKGFFSNTSINNESLFCFEAFDKKNAEDDPLEPAPTIHTLLTDLTNVNNKSNHNNDKFEISFIYFND